MPEQKTTYSKPYDWDKIISDWLTSEHETKEAFCLDRGLNPNTAKRKLIKRDKYAIQQTGSDEAGTDPAKLLLIQLLADPTDRRSKDEKSVQAGFAPKYVYQLLKNTNFLALLHKTTSEMVAAYRSRIYSNLLRDSDKGDTQAGIAYLKGCHDFQDGVNVHTNVVQQANAASFQERIGEAAELRRASTKNARRAVLEDRN